jgi:transposase
VLARALEQGSRLSAVRLAQVHAACDVLGLRQGFSENDLYDNLDWLCNRQEEIERRLFASRAGGQKPELFLYDVTSSYLEGQHNALGDYGYNRDGKRGKKQIVIGLLCGEQGDPVSTEVFRGNTQDLSTFAAQVAKAAERFGCQGVTFVGDRGMIKRAQIQDLARAGFHYLTAITKAQIDTLLTQGVIQMELFAEDLCEVQEKGVRYILRRNPARAGEVAASRQDKQSSVERLMAKQNTWLAEHPRAKVATAQRLVQAKIERLHIQAWLNLKSEKRRLELVVDEAALTEQARLDGCYALKTDVQAAVADTETVHERYKDLAEVEWAFRTCKSAHLEVRPVHVRTEEHTRGHVLVVMLAYRVIRALRMAWARLDVTVEEGLEHLKTLCSQELRVKGGGVCLRLPEPRDQSLKLLRAAGVKLPSVLPRSPACVVTHKKLPSRRRNVE